MPTLDFRGKQHIYAHHLTVPNRPLLIAHYGIAMGLTDQRLFRH